MPNWYVHLEVARRIAKILPALTPGENDAFSGSGLSPQDLARIIEDYPNYYALGAIGPDIFYFLPDFKGQRGNMIAEAASFIIRLYHVIDEYIVTPWQKTFGPIAEDSNELVSRLTGGLSDQLSQLCQYATGIITENIFDFLSVAFPDWFGLLGCGPGAAFDDSMYFWSDMFHYRRTNEFACDLFQHAMRFTYDDNGNSGPAAPGGWPGYEPGVAFALGWMTHVGTDVTGHAFTNAKVGGPFRLHWQRHHVVENHMDAYTYDKNHRGDQYYDMEAASALHFWVQFRDSAMPKYSPKYNYLLGVDIKPPDPDPNAPTAPLPQYPTDLTSRAYFDRHQIFNVDSKIPPPLVAFLRDVMQSTFYDRNRPDSNDSMPTHPMILAPVTGDARPDLGLMNANFQVLWEYVKLTTTGYYSMPKPVPPDLIPDNLDPPIPPTIDTPPGLDDPVATFLDVVLGVVAIIAYIGDWLLYLVSVLPGLIADLASYPARVVLYQFEMGFYLLWKAFRYLLVVEGFDLPEPDEVDLGLITLGVSSKGVSDDLLANTVADVWGGLFGSGAPPPSPDEPLPDPSYPRDTVVDEQNAIEKLVGAVEGVLDQVPANCLGTDQLGPNDARLPSEYLSPWRYPLRNYAAEEVLGEPAHTLPGPYRPGTAFSTPEFLVETLIPGTDRAREIYEAAATPAASDAAADALAQDIQHIAYVAYVESDFRICDLWKPVGQDAWSVDITQPAGVHLDVGYCLSSWVSAIDNLLHIAYFDPDGRQAYEFTRPGQPWSIVSVTEDAGVPAGGSNNLTSWISGNDNVPHIAYPDGDGHIRDFSKRPDQLHWSARDATQEAGAPPATMVRAITSWVSARDHVQHIAYINELDPEGDCELHELSMRPGQRWSFVNVSEDAGLPVTSLGAITSWVTADNVQHIACIAYVNYVGHVHDVYLPAGQSHWSARDATLQSGAPTAGGGLTSWVSSDDNVQHIACVGMDGHVWELWLGPGHSIWSARDATPDAGAQHAQGGFTSWVSATDHVQHIAYCDVSLHVRELWRRPGQDHWSGVDATATANAPDTQGSGPLTSWVAASDDNLGDPIHYSLYTIGKLTRDAVADPGNVASFNLDSDRGYGYKCWDYDRISGSDIQRGVPYVRKYAYYANSVPPTRYAIPCTPPRGFKKYSLCKDTDTVAPKGNPTLTNDHAIGGLNGILSVHDYHPLTDLRIHYLTRFLHSLAASPAHNAVVLTWQPMSGAVSYNLYRSTSGAGSWTKIADVSSPHIDSGLTNGRTYFYRASAVDPAGAESLRSAQAAAIPGRQASGAPARLTAAAGIRQAGFDPHLDSLIAPALEVTLTWESVPAVDSYVLYRSTDPGRPWVRYAQAAASRYTDIEVDLGPTYYYKVTAVHQGNESTASLVAGATPEFPGLQYPNCDHMIGKRT
jgi:Zinc dependent phospholipase C